MRKVKNDFKIQRKKTVYRHCGGHISHHFRNRIIYKDDKCRRFDRYLGNIGHQIVGNAVGVFANLSALVCTDGIKVTKQDDIPGRICLLDIG